MFLSPWIKMEVFKFSDTDIHNHKIHRHTDTLYFIKYTRKFTKSFKAVRSVYKNFLKGKLIGMGILISIFVETEIFNFQNYKTWKQVP